MTGSVISRGALRRATLLCPDGEQPVLRDLLGHDEMVAPLDRGAAIERLAAYLLDPLGRALLALDDSLALWFARSPLLVPVGPGNAAPMKDELAAVIVASSFMGEQLPPPLWRLRWSPRADVLFAATIGRLPRNAAELELARLAREEGPDEAVVHQAYLQAGRALAWAPHLHDCGVAEVIVDQLLVLIDRASPRPLLEALADALAPIARASTQLGAVVRDAAAVKLRSAVTRIQPSSAVASSFSAQLAALDQPGEPPELARMRTLPDWECAELCAHLLGAASPREASAFGEHRDRVTELFGDLPLTASFLDGLIQSACVEPLAELCIALAMGDPSERELAADLGRRLPLDPARPALLALAQDESAAVRADAARGLGLLGETDAVAALLRDPSPDVAAVAATTLVELGEGERCRTNAADDRIATRRAAIRAAAGVVDVETVGELVVTLAERLDAMDPAAEDDGVTGSPLLAALATAVFTSREGLALLPALTAQLPGSIPLLALATSRDDDPPGVLAPPDELARLTEALRPVLAADDELAATARVLLARLACGDVARAADVARALDATDGFGGQLLTALAELRVRSPETASALRELLAPDAPLGVRLLAAATSGRALPVDDPAWAHVRELLELGTIARAAAWAALRDRVRYHQP